MNPNGMPAWLRFALVAGIVVLVAGASLFAWRWYVRPTTLTIAVGSLDGEASRLVSALASKLAQQKAPVRLSVVETPSALDAASVVAHLAGERGGVTRGWWHQPGRRARAQRGRDRHGSVR